MCGMLPGLVDDMAGPRNISGTCRPRFEAIDHDHAVFVLPRVAIACCSLGVTMDFDGLPKHVVELCSVASP